MHSQKERDKTRKSETNKKEHGNFLAFVVRTREAAHARLVGAAASDGGSA